MWKLNLYSHLLCNSKVLVNHSLQNLVQHLNLIHYRLEYCYPVESLIPSKIYHKLSAIWPAWIHLDFNKRAWETAGRSPLWEILEHTRLLKPWESWDQKQRHLSHTVAQPHATAHFFTVQSLSCPCTCVSTDDDTWRMKSTLSKTWERLQHSTCSQCAPAS